MKVDFDETLIDSIIDECDVDHDGEISVQEFLDHFVQIPEIERPLK
mgnify:CR=1 FL=1